MWIAASLTTGYSNVAAYSYDGITWTGLGVTLGSGLTGVNIVAWNGQMWLASGPGGVAYSYNGINWKNSVNGPYMISLAWNGLMWVGSGGTSFSYYSIDGMSWATSPLSPLDGGLDGAFVIWTGSLWLMGGYASAAPRSVINYSYDGIDECNTGRTDRISRNRWTI